MRKILLLSLWCIGGIALATMDAPPCGQIQYTSLKQMFAAGPAQPPRQLIVDWNHRTPHAPPRLREIRTLSIKELGNFRYEPSAGFGVPPDVLRLNGMSVHLAGFMLPLNQAGKINQFALVPSLTSCCYGQPPTLQHVVIVNSSPYSKISFSSDPIEVVGRLTVRETRQDGYIISLFELKADKIISNPVATTN
jgi:hypothetical protein